MRACRRAAARNSSSLFRTGHLSNLRATFLVRILSDSSCHPSLLPITLDHLIDHLTETPSTFLSAHHPFELKSATPEAAKTFALRSP